MAEQTICIQLQNRTHNRILMFLFKLFYCAFAKILFFIVLKKDSTIHMTYITRMLYIHTYIHTFIPLKDI